MLKVKETKIAKLEKEIKNNEGLAEAEKNLDDLRKDFQVMKHKNELLCQQNRMLKDQNKALEELLTANTLMSEEGVSTATSTFNILYFQVVKPKEDIMALQVKINKALKQNNEVKEQVQKQDDKLKQANPFELVKAIDITFTKFDKDRYAILNNWYKGYFVINNWVLIGSLGDPNTWEGLAAAVSMKKGDKDGLAGTLIDMNVMQGILY